MSKTEIFLSIWGTVSSFALIYITGKSFKYKDIIVKIVEAWKDGKMERGEFNSIMQAIEKEIWPK